jgi:hypothetical protein
MALGHGPRGARGDFLADRRRHLERGYLAVKIMVWQVRSFAGGQACRVPVLGAFSYVPTALPAQYRTSRVN